ncbi:hypothetical protein D3C85_808520 [compost metagenome]
MGVALNVTEVPAQIGFADALMFTLAGKFGFTVIVIALEVAGLPVKQGVAFEVNTQVTMSPFAKAALVYVAAFDPTFVPFNFHWYAGVVPPFVGVAVKVTEVPAQIVFTDSKMLMLAGKIGFTVIVTSLDKAGFPVAQIAFEINSQLTISPFANPALVYVAEFEPTFIPFNFHW